MKQQRFILEKLLLFDLQLQHDSIKLHVEIIGSLQFPLVVLPDVQCMSACRGKLNNVQTHALCTTITKMMGAIFKSEDTEYGLSRLLEIVVSTLQSKPFNYKNYSNKK